MRPGTDRSATVRSAGGTLLQGGLLVLASACSTVPTADPANLTSIDRALEDSLAAEEDVPGLMPPPEVADALLQRMPGERSLAVPRVEPRFDVSVKAADASRFFMSLVKDTETNMVVHPDVRGVISLSLRDVTIEEVLDTVRDVHGYRYRRRGNTFQVFPADMRTEVFTVDYLDVVRNGNSRTGISSGEAGQDASDARAAVAASAATSASDPGWGVSGSEVRTGSRSDFWRDLRDSLSLIVGTENGRKVIVHSQSGVVVVHAMPEELFEVESYLDTIESVAHRLVVLEAKVIEVTLDESFQAGIDWNSLIDLGTDRSLLLGHSASGAVGSSLGGIFSINANLNDFSGLIELFRTQGDVQVLSSPRISTVNNQKAVIKVGQDEYFVTDFDTKTQLGDDIGTQNIDVALTPFFSGVALDVLPQIDADDNVILHIHPAISEVREEEKNIRVSTDADLSIPLALSTIRESDSVVRVRSGQVIVVGGLMKNATRTEVTRTPGLSGIPLLGNLFVNRREVMTKSELVILLRPIVIQDDAQWDGLLRGNVERYDRVRAPEGNDGARPLPPE